MDLSKTSVSDEKTRDIGIAVASWLCGTLEGISSDSDDLALAEALDVWLRKQKHKRRSLYIGRITCTSCGHAWETMVASDDVQLSCPQCGMLLETASLRLPGKNTAVPENKAALDSIRKELDDVVRKIASVNRTLRQDGSE